MVGSIPPYRSSLLDPYWQGNQTVNLVAPGSNPGRRANSCRRASGRARVSKTCRRGFNSYRLRQSDRKPTSVGARLQSGIVRGSTEAVIHGGISEPADTSPCEGEAAGPAPASHPMPRVAQRQSNRPVSDLSSVRVRPEAPFIADLREAPPRGSDPRSRRSVTVVRFQSADCSRSARAFEAR